MQYLFIFDMNTSKNTENIHIRYFRAISTCLLCTVSRVARPSTVGSRWRSRISARGVNSKGSYLCRWRIIRSWRHKQSPSDSRSADRSVASRGFHAPEVGQQYAVSPLRYRSGRSRPRVRWFSLVGRTSQNSRSRLGTRVRFISFQSFARWFNPNN